MASDLVGVLLGGGFGLAGAWLGTYMNQRSAIQTARQLVDVERHKFAQTRLWEAKKEAFTQIISELNGLQISVESIAEILFDHEVDPSPYIQSSDYSAAFGNLWKIVVKIDRMIDDNSLILPDEFQGEYAAWRGDFFNYNEDTSEREISITQSKALSSFKPKLVIIAKNELEALPSPT